MQDATLVAIGLLAGLGSACLVACGDIAAEPIVAFGGSSQGLGGMGAAGGTGGGGGTSGGSAQGGATELPPILGLCDVCDSSLACGDPDDDCLQINVAESPVTGTRFCARNCTEDGACPTGYGCNETSTGDDNPRSAQCAPRVGNCLHRRMVAPPPPLAEMRETLASELAEARAAFSLSLGALTEDPELDDVAQASVEEMAREILPFTKFDAECRNKPTCAAGWSAEQQVQVAAFKLDWASALPAGVVELTMKPGTSGSVELQSPDHQRFGIGIVMAGDEAFFSVTYGP